MGLPVRFLVILGELPEPERINHVDALHFLHDSHVSAECFFSVATNMGLHMARGVKPFQTNIIVVLVALFILNMISSGNLICPR